MTIDVDKYKGKRITAVFQEDRFIHFVEGRLVSYGISEDSKETLLNFEDAYYAISGIRGGIDIRPRSISNSRISIEGKLVSIADYNSNP